MPSTPGRPSRGAPAAARARLAGFGLRVREGHRAAARPGAARRPRLRRLSRHLPVHPRLRILRAHGRPRLERAADIVRVRAAHAAAGIPAVRRRRRGSGAPSSPPIWSGPAPARACAGSVPHDAARRATRGHGRSRSRADRPRAPGAARLGRPPGRRHGHPSPAEHHPPAHPGVRRERLSRRARRVAGRHVPLVQRLRRRRRAQLHQRRAARERDHVLADQDDRVRGPPLRRMGRAEANLAAPAREWKSPPDAPYIRATCEEYPGRGRNGSTTSRTGTRCPPEAISPPWRSPNCSSPTSAFFRSLR